MSRTLNPQQARAVYNRIGRLQDSQHFYEDAPLNDLVAHGDFAQAQAVFELGCGTGRFAAWLLREQLSAEAHYLGVDLSDTMLALSRERLQPWGDRVRVVQGDGTPRAPCDDAAFDRFVTTYVLDLLSVSDIRAWLDEAHRVLQPGGLLCAAGLTHGRHFGSRLLMTAWRGIHALRPQWVGGCRPLRLREYLNEARWRVMHHAVLEPWGMPSEVLVAERLNDGA